MYSYVIVFKVQDRSPSGHFSADVLRLWHCSVNRTVLAILRMIRGRGEGRAGGGKRAVLVKDILLLAGTGKDVLRRGGKLIWKGDFLGRAGQLIQSGIRVLEHWRWLAKLS